MKIKATVNLVKNQTGDLKAMANITIDGCFVVNDLCVKSGQNGLWVSMPAKKLTKEYKGKLWKDIAHPITAGCRKLIFDTVLEEYEKKATAENLAGIESENPTKNSESDNKMLTDDESIPF